MPSLPLHVNKIWEPLLAHVGLATPKQNKAAHILQRQDQPVTKMDGGDEISGMLVEGN